MKIQASIFILFAIAIIGGCKSSTTVVESNTGTLQGSVEVFGGANCSLLTNDTGVRIQIEGTSFSTTTDSAGKWNITNIPAGVYNILLISPTNDTTLLSQYQFSGAGTQFLLNQYVYDVKLRGNDSVPFISVSVSKDSGNSKPGSWNYVISSTVSLSGSHSVSGKSFTFSITDLNRELTAQSYFQASSLNFTISNISPLVVNDSFIHYPLTIRDSISQMDTAFLGRYSPQPGDTLQVMTITYTTYSPCETGNGAILCSRKIVLQ